MICAENPPEIEYLETICPLCFASAKINELEVEKEELIQEVHDLKMELNVRGENVR